MGARVTIKDLSPGTLYFLSLRAKNEKMGMYSEWSSVFELQTIHDVVPPMPPGNLQWTPVGTSFIATWEAPLYSEDGTPAYDLDGYEITFFAPAEGAVPGIPAPDPTLKIVVETRNLGYNLSFDENVHIFHWPRGMVAIEVRAFDRTGNKSQPAFAIAQNPVPAEVPAFDAEGMMDAIQFKWTQNPAPPDDDIKYYRIRRGLLETAIDDELYLASANTDSASWETFSNELQWFSITAVDVFYQESATRKKDSAKARSSLTIDRTAPSPPTNVVTSSEPDTQFPDGSRVAIPITWTASTDNDVQEYNIRYGNVPGKWTYIQVPGEQESGAKTEAARLGGLIAGNSYYVAVQAVDFQRNVSTFTQSATYPQPTKQDTIGPSTPAAPVLAVNQGGTQVQVQHLIQKASGGNLERDLSHFEVYASTVSGFTPSAANKIGDMEATPPSATGGVIASIETFTVIPTAGTTVQTWFVKVIAVDIAGNKSQPSAQNSGQIPLLDAIAISDATITTAKIRSLEAQKITAGTGIINDLKIRSKLTVGDKDASNNIYPGTIASVDYDGPGGAAGWEMAHNSLNINNGVISAKAINLQNGTNIIEPSYASFDNFLNWYTDRLFETAGIGTRINEADDSLAKYAPGSLIVTSATGTTNGRVYFGSSDTDYRTVLDGGAPYIFSGYAKVTGGTAVSVRLGAKAGDSTVQTGASTAINATGWTRVKFAFVQPLASEAGVLFLQMDTAGATVAWDGMQLERQTSQSTEPSQWAPSGTTSIDGGQIRTGSISSNDLAIDFNGNTIPDTPAWFFNTLAGGSIGKLNVRGTLIVGPTNGNDARSSVKSGVFVASSPDISVNAGGTGWIIRGDGTAEFNNVRVRGTIIATAGEFTGSIYLGRTTDDIGSVIKSRNYVPSAAGAARGVGWQINGAGQAQFNDIVARGHIDAYSGYFAGQLNVDGNIIGNQNISGATITAGLIKGATLTSTQGGETKSRVQIDNGGYAKIQFWPDATTAWVWGGVTHCGDIRMNEAYADKYLQIYAPQYGGRPRPHISLGPDVGDQNPTEISIIAPYNSYGEVGTVYVVGQIKATDDIRTGYYSGTANLAIGRFGSSEGWLRGVGYSNSGLRLGADSYVRVVDVSGGSYINLSAANIYSNGTRVTSDPRLKTDVKANKLGIDTVRQAPVHEWHWNQGADTERKNIGLMTSDLPQQVIDIPPAIVEGAEQYEYVSMYDLVGILWHAIRELDMELDDVRAMMKKPKPDRKLPTA